MDEISVKLKFLNEMESIPEIIKQFRLPEKAENYLRNLTTPPEFYFKSYCVHVETLHICLEFDGKCYLEATISTEDMVFPCPFNSSELIDSADETDIFCLLSDVPHWATKMDENAKDMDEEEYINYEKQIAEKIEKCFKWSKMTDKHWDEIINDLWLTPAEIILIRCAQWIHSCNWEHKSFHPWKVDGYFNI